MAYDRDNVFAKILRGEAPAHAVAENDDCMAFMDLMPQSPGHTLIVPRCAAENLFDVGVEALRHVVVMTQRVAKAVNEVFEPDGMMIAQLNGAAAGQSVFHLHFHVIPRYASEGLKFHARDAEPSSTLAEHAQLIRSALER